MSKITYTDKEYIYENAEIPEINKITDGNMNEIKSVVNENDTRLTTAEGEIDNAEAVIGNETDTYSASSTYALGSLVIYNSLLYKCTTAITVAEAWNASKWTQVSLTSLAQSGDVYSTTEQVIGTWIDGKPIYKKVLSYTGTIANSGTLNHGISNLGQVIEAKGFTYNPSWGFIPIPLVHNYLGGMIGFGAINQTNLTWYVGVDISDGLQNVPIIFIMEYTKTTD